MLVLAQNIYTKVVSREDIFEIGDFTRDKLSDVYDNLTKTIKSTEDVGDQFTEYITGEPDTIKTGYKTLDSIVNGFEKKEITIMAGRPSMGKTALGLNIARNALVQGKKVAIVSLEMSARQLFTRLVAMETGYDINKLKDKEFYEINKGTITEAVNKLKQQPLFIDDESSDLNEIINRARQMKMKEGIDMFIVDYLQLVNYSDSRRSREQEVAFIAKQLKNELARQLDIPLILLSQLSRKTEERKGNQPMLSDLRESGAIENDADTVILIHRPDYYDKNKMGNEKQDVELIVAKGRNVGTGIAKVMYNPYQTLFYED